MLPELETLHNFCPSIFSQVCPDFHFRQNAYLLKVCLDFFVSNVNLYSVVTRKSRHTFHTDLSFEENENLDTLEKI